jgi:beta-glucosidase
VHASTIRPVKELKDFQLVTLEKGAVKTIQFVLELDALGFYDGAGDFKVEPGRFKVYVGGDSTTNLYVDFELV